jgi:hypothetical protein
VKSKFVRSIPVLARDTVPKSAQTKARDGTLVEPSLRLSWLLQAERRKYQSLRIANSFAALFAMSSNVSEIPHFVGPHRNRPPRVTCDAGTSPQGAYVSIASVGDRCLDKVSQSPRAAETPRWAGIKQGEKVVAEKGPPPAETFTFPQATGLQ